jgi:hypothetical protein
MGKIAVLGLGESLAEYTQAGGWDYTIGVNDIWRAVQTDAVVCVDKRERFTEERLAVIDASRPQRFYTHLPEWHSRPDAYPIELQEMFPDYVCQLHTGKVPKSMCSPFVAAAIAFMYHGATEIHLYGVDMVSHPHLKDQMVAKIVKHFKALKVALTMDGCQLHVHGNGVLKAL